MTDLISRNDAFGAVQDHFDDDGFKGYNDGQKMMDRHTDDDYCSYGEREESEGNL